MKVEFIRVLSRSVHVNPRQGNNENTSAYNVSAWGAQGKGLTTLAQTGRFHKGMKVTVSGKLTAREYTDRSGANRTSLDVDAWDVEPHFPPRATDDMNSVTY